MVTPFQMLACTYAHTGKKNVLGSITFINAPNNVQKFFFHSNFLKVTKSMLIKLLIIFFECFINDI